MRQWILETSESIGILNTVENPDHIYSARACCKTRRAAHTNWVSIHRTKYIHNPPQPQPTHQTQTTQSTTKLHKTVQSTATPTTPPNANCTIHRKPYNPPQNPAKHRLHNPPQPTPEYPAKRKHFAPENRTRPLRPRKFSRHLLPLQNYQKSHHAASLWGLSRHSRGSVVATRKGSHFGEFGASRPAATADRQKCSLDVRRLQRVLHRIALLSERVHSAHSRVGLLVNTSRFPLCLFNSAFESSRISPDGHAKHVAFFK